jgi:mono/diheme cytochrome c family protein
MKRTVIIVVMLGVGSLANLASTEVAGAQQAAIQRGANLARNNCAKCHAIDKLSPSPLVIAPPFRDLHKRYPVESLAEALAEGIVTGHPTMPEFRFPPDQINDFIAFLRSLE